MKITPLEIRQKTFEKVFRGYDKDEVQAYLHSLSMEWERLLDENKDLYHKIDNLQAESSKLRELESSLFKTLKTAEDTGATLIEQAKKETDLKMKESAIKAENILADARGKAKTLVENAESKKKQILDEMINKIRLMENLFNQLADLKEKVVGQVKNYSNDLLERIEKLERKSEALQIADLVAEAKKIYNSSILGEDIDDSKEPKEDEKNTEGDSKTVSAEVVLDKEKVTEEKATVEPDVKHDEEAEDKKEVPSTSDQGTIKNETMEKKSKSFSKSFFDELE